MKNRVNFLKWYYDQKTNLFFSLDFKTMLTKHQVTQVLSSDFKKTPEFSYLLVRHYEL